MVKWKNKEYSGSIVRNDDDVLTVLIYSFDTIQDILANLGEVTEVSEYTNESDVTSYSVTFGSSVKTISANTYFIEFSKKQPKLRQLEEQISQQAEMIRKQSEIIDDLIISALEE